MLRYLKGMKARHSLYHAATSITTTDDNHTETKSQDVSLLTLSLIRHDDEWLVERIRMSRGGDRTAVQKQRQGEPPEPESYATLISAVQGLNSEIVRLGELHSQVLDHRERVLLPYASSVGSVVLRATGAESDSSHVRIKQ